MLYFLAPLSMIPAFSRWPAPTLDGPLAWLDRARAWGLLLFPREVAHFWSSREHRAAATATFLVSVSLFLSVSWPMVLAVVGPLLWGIPHVVSDVRYLVFRPRLHKKPRILVALLIGIGLSAAGLGVRGALLGAALATVVVPAPWRRKGLVLAVLLVALAAAHWAGFYADLAYVHLHHFVGVGIWLAWRRRATNSHFAFLAVFVIGSFAILVGALDPWVSRTGGLVSPFSGLTFRDLAFAVSPVLEGPWAGRLVVWFVFTQAAHYVVWLRLVPEDDRPSPAPRSYVQSFRALRRDVGAVVLWIAFTATLVFAAWAAKDPGQSRNVYILTAFFHGYLEIGVAAIWAAGGFFDRAGHVFAPPAHRNGSGTQE